MLRSLRCDVVNIGGGGKTNPAKGCDLEGEFLIKGSKRRSSPEIFLALFTTPVLCPSVRDTLLPEAARVTSTGAVCGDTWEATCSMNECKSSENEGSGTTLHSRETEAGIAFGFAEKSALVDELGVCD